MQRLHNRLDKIEAAAEAARESDPEVQVWHRVPPDAVPPEHAGLDAALCSHISHGVNSIVPPAPPLDNDANRDANQERTTEPPEWIDESDLSPDALTVIVDCTGPAPEVVA